MDCRTGLPFWSSFCCPFYFVIVFVSFLHIRDNYKYRDFLLVVWKKFAVRRRSARRGAKSGDQRRSVSEIFSSSYAGTAVLFTWP